MADKAADAPTAEERIAELEVRLSEIVAACAWLHRSITEAAVYTMAAQKAGLASAFRAPDAAQAVASMAEAGKRLDEALEGARVLIWKDEANGEGK